MRKILIVLVMASWPSVTLAQTFSDFMDEYRRSVTEPAVVVMGPDDSRSLLGPAGKREKRFEDFTEEELTQCVGPIECYWRPYRVGNDTIYDPRTDKYYRRSVSPSVPLPKEAELTSLLQFKLMKKLKDIGFKPLLPTTGAAARVLSKLEREKKVGREGKPPIPLKPADFFLASVVQVTKAEPIVGARSGDNFVTKILAMIARKKNPGGTFDRAMDDVRAYREVKISVALNVEVTLLLLTPDREPLYVGQGNGSSVSEMIVAVNYSTGSVRQTGKGVSVTEAIQQAIDGAFQNMNLK